MPTQIKICGIKQPNLSYRAAQAGADFIGIVFAPTSKRAVTTEVAQEIAQSARAGGAEPVAVFTEDNAENIRNICEKTNITWVQLHGNLSRKEQHLLPEHIHRIYVYSISPSGELKMGDPIKKLDKKRDYLLFDSLKAGSGETFNWQKFSYTGDFPWFLSGGLNTQNIGEAIRLLHPTTVDVSSGVENMAGEKTIELIKQFIESVQKNS